MIPEDDVTQKDLILVNKYESEIVTMLRDYLNRNKPITNGVERAAGYIAGLCTAVTAIAFGALGPEDAPKYLSAGINRAIEGITKLKDERDKQTENKS